MIKIIFLIVSLIFAINISHAAGNDSKDQAILVGNTGQVAPLRPSVMVGQNLNGRRVIGNRFSDPVPLSMAEIQQAVPAWWTAPSYRHWYSIKKESEFFVRLTSDEFSETQETHIDRVSKTYGVDSNICRSFRGLHHIYFGLLQPKINIVNTMPTNPPINYNQLLAVSGDYINTAHILFLKDAKKLRQLFHDTRADIIGGFAFVVSAEDTIELIEKRRKQSPLFSKLLYHLMMDELLKVWMDLTVNNITNTIPTAFYSNLYVEWANIECTADHLASAHDKIHIFTDYHSSPTDFQSTCKAAYACMVRRSKVHNDIIDTKRKYRHDGKVRDKKVNELILADLTRLTVDADPQANLKDYILRKNEVLKAQAALLIRGNEVAYKQEITTTMNEIAEAILKVRTDEDRKKCVDCIACVYETYAEALQEDYVNLLVRDAVLWIHAGSFQVVQGYLNALHQLNHSSSSSRVLLNTIPMLELILKICNGEVVVEAVVEDGKASPATPPQSKPSRRKRSAMKRDSIALMPPVFAADSQTAAAEVAVFTEADREQERREQRQAVQAALAKAEEKPKKKADKPRPEVLEDTAVQPGSVVPAVLNFSTARPRNRYLAEFLMPFLPSLIPLRAENFLIITDYAVPHLTGLQVGIEDSIDANTWNFSREDFTKYLKAFNFVLSSKKHQKAAAPVIWEEICHKTQESVVVAALFAEDDLSIGSFTLPRWGRTFVPYYMRKQIMVAYAKICRMTMLSDDPRLAS